MSKRKTFGIVLFIVIGLFMFTFANPNEPVGEGEQVQKEGTIGNTESVENNEEIENNNETIIVPVVNENNTVENEEPVVDENNTEETEEPVVDENNTEETEEPKVEEDNTEETEEPKVEEDNTEETEKPKVEEDNTEEPEVEEDNTIETEEPKVEEDNTVEPEVEDITGTTNDLNDAKSSAIEEIEKYRNDYSYINEEEYTNLLEEIKGKITESKSNEEINNNLNNGKLLVDNLIEKDLNEYKKYKKEELQTYKDVLVFNELDNEASKIVLDAFDKINNAESKEVIETIVIDTKNKLNELKLQENIENAINKAIEEIEKYRNDYSYTNEEEYTNLLEEIKGNITESKTKEEVNNNLNNGKLLVDNLIEKDLNEYRENAIKQVNEYNVNELYSEENQKLIATIKENAVKQIVAATTKKEIDEAVENAKNEINKIKKLTETYYTVEFIGLNGTLLKSEQVLYGNNAIEPEVNDIILNGITYEFVSWDTDYTNVKSTLVVNANYNITKIDANILLDNNLLDVIELNINSTILETINKNEKVTLTNSEEEIKNIVKGTLPVLNKQNYKYEFTSLNYNEDGFNIIAIESIDEEELNKNTVTVTYTINNDEYIFDNNTNIITNTVTNGKNVVTNLPKVYKNNKEVAVIWKDMNNNIISNITTNSVNLNEELIYNQSVTLTAYLDETKPVITLKGELNNQIELSLTEEYIELGYSALDNFDGDITSLVNVSVTYNGALTNQVDYSKAGEYIVTYSVTNSNGLTTSVTRTITVIDPITEIKASVFVLNDGLKRPENNDATPSSNYSKIGEVNLVVNSVRKYLNGPKTIISNTNIDSYVIGTLPTLNDKYYYYEYYVIKYEKDGFHIDCEKIFDVEKYTNDKLAELNELLNKDYSEYGKTKTTDSYNNLLNALKNGKNAKTLEQIEDAIILINNSINNLVNVELIKLELSSNNDTYYLNDNIKKIEVKAIYNDSTKNKTITDYVVSNVFDTTTVGDKTLIYSYGNKKVVYNYTVEYSPNYLDGLVRDMKITLSSKKECHEKKCDTMYTINFDKLRNVDVKSIEIIKNNKVFKTIKFNNKNNNILTISKSDYELLKQNNTLIGDQVIRITYKVKKQEVSVDYYELFNTLNRL